ncbi:MAG: DUF1648 domain-containing protein [Bacteroidales bacterium]
MNKVRQENKVSNKFFEGLCALLALCLFIIPLIYYKSLPENIPVHYNFYGFPDGYGNKNSLFFIASLGFIIYIIVLFAGFMGEKYYNIPFKTTPDGKSKIVFFVRKVLKVLRFNTLIIFNFAIVGIILNSFQYINGLGRPSFVIVVLMILLPVILMFIGLKKLANNSIKS